MTQARFLGIIRIDALAGGCDAAGPWPLVPVDLPLLCEMRHCRIYAGDGQSVRHQGGMMGVLGTAYRYKDNFPVATEDDLVAFAAHFPEERSEIWGDFVCVAETEGGISVYRSALGRTPCYYRRVDGWLMFASDIDLLHMPGEAPMVIDWDAVSHHLLFPSLRIARTCLEHVRELLGGELLELSTAGETVSTIWSPWAGQPWRHRLTDAAEAQDRVRTTTMRIIRRVSEPFRHIIVGVSGGLDSSIVAAALSRAGQRTTLVTLVSPDPRGDERRHARALASHLGAKLEERVEEVEFVDPLHSLSGHLPRPLARSFAQSGDRILSEIASSRGGDAYFTGAGGDNVFCYLRSATPVAELLRRGQVWKAVRCAGDMGVVTGAGTGKALKLGLVRAFGRTTHYRWPMDGQYLGKRTLEGRHLETHPWMADQPGGLPALCGHVAAILAIENHLEGTARERDCPLVSPLVARPLVELALTIPAWMWCRRGRNRAVARDAFADMLPDTLINRQSKGSPDGFAAAVFEHNRTRIREFLCDGLLSNAGILDREAIAAALARDEPVKGTGYLRFLAMSDVEAWCRLRTAPASA